MFPKEIFIPHRKLLKLSSQKLDLVTVLTKLLGSNVVGCFI